MRECPKCNGCYDGIDMRCALDSCDLIDTISCGCTIAARYQLEMRLGTGRQGITYRAKEMSTLDWVVIKIFVPARDQRNLPAEFRRAAAAASKLEHENLVSVKDFGVMEINQDLLAYSVMDYAEGWPLSTLIRDQKRLTPAYTLEILQSICDGLSYAHALGIIHGGLKPGNIWLCSSGVSQEVIKVLDCGLSMINVGETPSNIDGSKSPGESYCYLSPEQCQQKPADVRSDVYSLGVIAYEMLAGVPPFRGEPAEVQRKQIKKKPSSLWLWHRVPRKISKVIHKALSKDPRSRYQSVDEFINALSKSNK